MIDLEGPLAAAFNNGMEVRIWRDGSSYHAAVYKDRCFERSSVGRLYMLEELIYDLIDQLNERTRKVK